MNVLFEKGEARDIAISMLKKHIKQKSLDRCKGQYSRF